MKTSIIEYCEKSDFYVIGKENESCDMFKYEVLIKKYNPNSLPDIELKICNLTFIAEGQSPKPWSIYSEIIDEKSARTIIRINNRVIADLTIHSKNKNTLPNSVLDVSSVILWSKLGV